MDRRIIKSKQKIYKAFMEIREKKELRRITVKEICEKAEINKSTFYEHYDDIFDLSDKIESAAVASVISNIQPKDCIITNPATSVAQLFNALLAEDDLKIIFGGESYPHLVNKLSESFKNIIFEKYPNLKNNTEFNILIDYETFGGYYAYEANIKSPDKSAEAIETIIKVTSHMDTLIKERTKYLI